MFGSLLLIFTNDFYSLNKEMQEKIYKQFYAAMYPMVFSYLKDHASSEDVIQESFLKTLEKAHQLDDLKKMESWLKTLTRRNAINHLNKFKKMRNELASNSVFTVREQKASLVSRVDEQIEVKMLKESIIRYMHDMNPKYRIALDLRWHHELSYEEIAEEMNITMAAVRQLLFRARNEIKKRLIEEWKIDE